MSAPPAPKKARRNEFGQMQEDSILCEDEEEDSAFTLYFVEVSDGNPTEQEIKNMTGLFKIAKTAGVMPEWISSESMERIHSSDDFFVLPCFRGRLFRTLKANKMKLYGPPIVLECLTDLKPLPQWTHPIYSSAFEGAKITFTSIEPEKRQELSEKIAWMNGVVSGVLYYESTHLIAGKADQTEKYKVAVSNSIHLMRKEWVDDLWETSQTTMGKFSALGKDAINSFKLRVFEGLEMAVTSIDGADRINLIQLVEEHGGTVPGNMSKSKCSHLITDKTSGQKYLKATEWKTICVVQTRWVRKCIDSGHLILEAKYHPKYFSAEHIRSSTPKRDTSVFESVPDVSSIAGHGGRLNASSFNLSSAMTPVETSSRRQSGSSFISMSSTSNVASTTVNSDVTIGRLSGTRKSDQFSAPTLRNTSVPMSRYPTAPSMAIQSSASVSSDPITEVRKLVDSELRELFDNCIFYMIGLDEKKSESWVRLFNETGATRVSRFESATHVVVVSANQQERISIRRIMQQEDINVVTVQWVVESIKQKTLLSTEDFAWSEILMDDFQSQSQNDELMPLDSPNTSQLSHRISEPNVSNNLSCPPIFSHQTYFVHPSLGEDDVAHFSDLIRNNGGRIEMNPENAKYVVFGHSAPMHILLHFDVVITTLYVDTCLNKGFCPPLKNHALLVPLPSPPLPIFQNRRFVLRNQHPHVISFVKDIIEANGGTVVDEMDSNAFKIMVGPGTMMDEPEYSWRTADLSWIIASVSRCQLQPFEDHLYKEKSTPLSGFEREDDVWMKCVAEKDESTEEMEQEVEDRHRVEDKPMSTRNGGRRNITSPYENPYFPDLRKPYKMNLHLEGIDEYIDNMESPPIETQESMTNSRVGSILRKAVVNTGRRVGEEKDDEPMTCEVIKPTAPENRRTVSSTPVLIRDFDRSTRFMPMDESFADQNQEHEELNRQYAMHPHFLLSVSNMNPEQAIALQESIQQLGGKIEKDFNRDVTHLITSNMQRTPKVLSSIAAGKWCLTPEYVTKSTASGRWLDEKKFEWTLDKLPKITACEESTKDRDNRKILEKLVSVCKVWRIRIEEMPITSSVRMENRVNGAFTGWRCVIHHDDKKTQQIASILEAGGAIVHSITDYIEISTLDPNRVFAFKDFKWNPQSAAMLKRDKIPLYVFEIIYEYLVDNGNMDRSKFLHPVYKNV